MTLKARVSEHSMWAFQSDFQKSAEADARELFGRIGSTLIPKVGLIGKIEEDQISKPHVCLEPSDFCDASIFDAIDTLSLDFSSFDPEQTIVHAAPDAPEVFPFRLKKKWIRDGFLRLLVAHDAHGAYFGSMPVPVEGYDVVVMLRFDKTELESLYSLKRREVANRVEVNRSLLEAMVEEYFEAMERSLIEAQPGKAQDPMRYDEAMRTAGQNLMHTTAWYGGNIAGLHGLYDYCENISLARYEGHAASGSLIIARRGHPAIETVVAFMNPTQIRQTRAVRKLLETSSETLALLCDSSEIYGLGRCVDYDTAAEDVYEIKFSQRHSWTLLHGGRILMKVDDGLPFLPQKTLKESKFLADLHRIFPEIPPAHAKHLFELLETASLQQYGSMLVISGEAAAEAARLKSQSTPIQPIRMTRDLVAHLSSIDGAILLDPNGICHAIGVVLDGLASNKGDSSRGARFNSAIRYIELKPRSLVLVISDDGTIDLLPRS